MYYSASAIRLSWLLLSLLAAPLATASADESEPAQAPDRGEESPAGDDASASEEEEPPIPNMNAEDYRLYQEYLAALRDPRVQAFPERQRMGRIARNFGVSLPRLREVVDLGDEIGEGQLERQQAAALAALEAAGLDGRIRSVEFVDNKGIVVAYVAWRCSEQERLVPEAALVAKTVADAAPMAELVALWSCMGRHKVFTARIQCSSASRFSLDRIDDFAATRYIRLFEDVHNRFDGQPPEDNLGCD